jgi:hypothetical protein
MTQIWSEVWKELIRWWKKVWFEAKLTARLKMIELENQWESEQERKERFEPIYQEKEIDNELQTGKSRLLGGEMRLVAKWVAEAEAEVEKLNGRGETSENSTSS